MQASATPGERGAWRQSAPRVAGWMQARLPRDARLYQILFLAVLLGSGVVARDFALRWEQAALTFAAGMTTQLLWARVLNLPKRNWLSAIITCFGVSILLRADSLWVHPLAVMLALSAKFVVRSGNKHVFNPANLGVILAITLVPGAWISPGQWGNDLAYAAWFVVLGALVTQRARRWDISWVFLLAFLGLIALRIAWLGQSWAVLGHQLQSGALLLFAFFMISDPMTIPNHRGARVIYAMLVASVAFVWQYQMYKPNALVWALFLATPLVPVLDRLLPAPQHVWRQS